ncbi:Usher syndrome type-1G protein homolog [Aplysia californica]|uniref:Usher syndrome type-1G protein homolog n=1 Tax=Aplysia californica TaxID=6500 RepID=A0ABM0JTM1_APLCA|nr:Usher syndrome type-1G protein homolog [Aplysia californica]XP_005101207.1 Usher syndrome type-1G protein homolog [Aplysia californica]
MAERFIAAAKDGYVDLLKEATKRDLNYPDEDGITATMWAARNGNLEALRLIVGRQGDVNANDFLGFTALHHATQRGHFDVVSYLVYWGCNVHALDNDLHSALDLAAMYNRTDIVKFLDSVIAQRQAKNPKQFAKQKEEAMRVAEANVKKYEKLQDAAAKRSEKEHRKMEQQVQQQLQENGVDQKQKKSFIKTLTLRIKGQNSLQKRTKGHSNNYSEMAGLTYGGRSGISKKIQMRRLESLTPDSSASDISTFSGNRQKSLRSQSIQMGISGSAADVEYRTASRGESFDDLGVSRRPVLPQGFGHSNLYKPRSESDILESSRFDEEESDGEEESGMFTRPGFAKISFLPKHGFLSTIQSFEENGLTNGSPDVKRLSGDGEEEVDQGQGYDEKSQVLPWDQDDLGNLDDDAEEDDKNELSAIEMFVCACGLASYLHIFSKEKIDMPLLMSMTDEEFRELGLPFGPRKKLKEAIVRRKTVLEAPTKMTASQL